MPDNANTIERVASWLADARHAVIFTGAGISTESGIPDFRSPGGVWSRNRPVYYDEFLASAEARFEYWRQKAEAAGDFEKAEPNAGHLVIARWEQVGRIAAVITQNIDGLHQQAGSRRVQAVDVLRDHGRDPANLFPAGNHQVARVRLGLLEIARSFRLLPPVFKSCLGRGQKF